MIEFEVKARVPDPAALLRELGGPERVEEHADLYLAHPARDFAATDEALRLSSRGGRSDITYKGPKLDAGSKARREIVVPVPDAAAARAMLEALGFRAVREVRKTRRLFRAEGFEVALDEVPGLGTYVELERVLPEGADRRWSGRRSRFSRAGASGRRSGAATWSYSLLASPTRPAGAADGGARASAMASHATAAAALTSGQSTQPSVKPAMAPPAQMAT
ncbi:MAG TPA: class IV adenylate cyclase [Candidatus Thermoplasmatota archaeon]|nr:class IV adenylate cyclase [Candidatus Thermoplasmatota archaeon]